MGEPRYFLDQDNSSHWYIVPLDRKAEWEAWLAIDEDDEASWDAPEWAKSIGGSPTLVTFTDPRIIERGLPIKGFAKR